MMSDVYPINDYGPLMPGLVIGGVAIFHVFLAQFAVGGGMLMCYFQWLAMTGRNQYARRFVDGYFKVLVLVSFVLGALTGVGIWFTAIQVSAPTIGAMVLNFHWLWAVEWTFFCLEIAAGYCFYRYHERLSDRTSLGLLIVYSIAAWASLFIINGIISWQLTPGRWVATHSVWDGFFNPTFWPSLLFRTVVATTLAALAACVVVNTMGDLAREPRRSLINRAAHFLVPMLLMPLLGAWFLAAMPADSRGWVLGGSPTMMLFMMLAISASVAIGGYALIGLVLQRLYINGATATLLLLLAYGATAGGEFVREGSRKPFSIRHVLYSTGVYPEDVPRLREVGAVADDPFPLRDGAAYPNDQLRLGARVYRRLCSTCHTVKGANDVVGLTRSWDVDQMRMNIAKLQHTKPFMPPFAGSPAELEALVQFLRWSAGGRADVWPQTDSSEVLVHIGQWLAEAGTAPGVIQPISDQPSSTN
jgi:cytochrome d ubiquinol oxidase subunit I